MSNVVNHPFITTRLKGPRHPMPLLLWNEQGGQDHSLYLLNFNQPDNKWTLFCETVNVAFSLFTRLIWTRYPMTSVLWYGQCSQEQTEMPSHPIILVFWNYEVVKHIVFYLLDLNDPDSQSPVSLKWPRSSSTFPLFAINNQSPNCFEMAKVIKHIFFIC